MSQFIMLGEGKTGRETIAVPPLAAVAAATRPTDYLPIMRSPSQPKARTTRIRKVKFDPAQTQAAAATNFVTLQCVKVIGTTVTAVGTSITTNTGGGWTSLTELDLIRENVDNVVLKTNERLALRITNTGTGVATVGFGLHVEYELF